MLTIEQAKAMAWHVFGYKLGGNANADAIAAALIQIDEMLNESADIGIEVHYLSHASEPVIDPVPYQPVPAPALVEMARNNLRAARETAARTERLSTLPRRALAALNGVGTVGERISAVEAMLRQACDDE